MPEHKADVHPKRRSYALRMAKGDTGRNYLNEFFDIIFYSVDNMLYEFGLFKDRERFPAPARKPLRGQENAQTPSAKAQDFSPTPAGQSILEYIPADAEDTGGTSGDSQQASVSQPMSGNTQAQWGNSGQALGGRPMSAKTRIGPDDTPPPSSPQ